VETPGLEGFRERLRTIIGEDSVSRFAIEVGLGDNLIRKYLEGGTPGLDKVVRICRMKNVSIAWLAMGQGDERGTGTHVVREPSAAYMKSDVLEFLELPHYTVKASAGLGRDNDDAPPAHFNKYRRDWWATTIGVDCEQCFTLEIQGDSMAPKLTEKDRPIINKAESNVLVDAIYVFRLDGEVFIKYLDRIPGRGLVARSVNERHAPWEIGDGSTFSEFRVIGRAIYKETGEKL
jgi:phage repressor protein C with HTH and peptisase S24 domain